MNSLPVEVCPALATKAVLDAYARYLLQQATANQSDANTMDETSSLQQQQQQQLSDSGAVPESLEAALAPLEVLYGKTALSAIGIALHGAEPVVRFVEEVAHVRETVIEDEATSDDEDVDEVEEEEVDDEQRSAPSAAPHTGQTKKEKPTRDTPVAPPMHAEAQTSTRTPAALHSARFLYHVGEHTLFSPFYCPCSAYAYQSVQRQEVWCCKHLLALQLALRVEATGLPQDTLRVRVVDAAAFEQLLWKAL